MTTRRSCRRGLALGALRTILVSRPELARVFFLKGQDGLARHMDEFIASYQRAQHICGEET